MIWSSPENNAHQRNQELYVLLYSKRGLGDSWHKRAERCVRVCFCVNISLFRQTYALHFSGVFTFFSLFHSIVAASSHFSPSRRAVLRWSRLLTSHIVNALCSHSMGSVWRQRRPCLQPAAPVQTPGFTNRVRRWPEEVDVTVWRHEAKYSFHNQLVHWITMVGIMHSDFIAC